MEDIVQDKEYQEVTKYKITLKRLSADDLELVRKWRNDPKIVKYMHYKEYITSEMQQKWFSGINNRNNYYFIIIADGLKIGLINFKDIDYDRKTMEAGIFIYNDNYLNTLVPFQIALAQYDFGFFDLGMKICKGLVLKSNTNAIKFNALLGYELAEGQDGLEHQLYLLSKERYSHYRGKLLKKLIKHINIGKA
jgi:RimJ/RimL family protein N-acetyltransferase